MKLTTAQRKKFRIRSKLKRVSSPDRFRLSLSRSTKNISAQIIDDVKNITQVILSLAPLKGCQNLEEEFFQVQLVYQKLMVGLVLQ